MTYETQNTKLIVRDVRKSVLTEKLRGDGAIY